MDWTQVYASALLEHDRAKFLAKAVSAKGIISTELAAMHNRRYLVGEAPDSRAAKRALEEALNNLNLLLAEDHE